MAEKKEKENTYHKAKRRNCAAFLIKAPCGIPDNTELLVTLIIILHSIMQEGSDINNIRNNTGRGYIYMTEGRLQTIAWYRCASRIKKV